MACQPCYASAPAKQHRSGTTDPASVTGSKQPSWTQWVDQLLLCIGPQPLAGLSPIQTHETFLRNLMSNIAQGLSFQRRILCLGSYLHFNIVFLGRQPAHDPCKLPACHSDYL